MKEQKPEAKPVEMETHNDAVLCCVDKTVAEVVPTTSKTHNEYRCPKCGRNWAVEKHPNSVMQNWMTRPLQTGVK